MSGKRRITVTLDDVLVNQLDEAARDVGVRRSRLIAALIENAHWSDTVEELGEKNA